MKNSIRVGMLVGSTALLGSLAHADQWSDKFPHIKNTGDIAGECSYDAMSKNDVIGRLARLKRNHSL